VFIQKRGKALELKRFEPEAENPVNLRCHNNLPRECCTIVGRRPEVASFGIGAKLRQERLSLGRSIEDVARETRISEKFLDAIEREDFERLPGLLFTRNFVRQYAQSLKLDPDPLLAELPKPDESAVRLPEAPAPVPYGRDWQIGSFVWFALAAAAILGAWYLSHSMRTRVSSSPNPVASARPVTTSAPARAPDPVAQPQATPSPDTTSPETQQASDRTPAQPTAAPDAGAAAQAAAALPVRVVLKAQQTSWVQMSADGKVAFTGTLQPNDTKEISANERIKILTGNAGGLTISLNGKTLEPLGPSGQVRSVMLTAEGPQLPAKAPPPEPDQL
jgi:cytoskeleton protein RodZ